MPRLSHSTERGRETLYALREALFSLMSEKEFDQISVKDLTDRAGIDRSTFYLHCSDKRDLLLRSQRQLIADLIAHFPTDASMEDRLREGFEHMAANRTAYRALLAHSDLAAEQSMEAFLAERVTEGLACGPLRLAAEEQTRAFVAQAVTSVIRGIAKWWLAQEDPLPPSEVASLTQQFLLHGLSSFSDHSSPFR